MVRWGLGVALVCVLGGLVASAALPAQRASVTVTALAPPPDGQAYFGFTFRLWDSSDPGNGDTRPFATRIEDAITNELGGRRPTFLTLRIAWGDNFDEASSDYAAVESASDPHGFLYIDWSMADDTQANGLPTVKDVEDGSQDAYIRNFANALRAYGKPVLLRLFGGEFNGNWEWSQSPLANPSLTTADFVAAWRHVVDIFRQQNALNVSWAWIPNAYVAGSTTGTDGNVAAYYPGDDYVDWAGADMYDYSPVTGLDPAYAFATAHGKPFFLAEFGVRSAGSGLTPTQDNDWLNAMFDYFQSHSDVKAISYFDYDNRSSPLDAQNVVSLDGGAVSYEANADDWDSRLIADSGAGFRNTYSTRIGSSHYVSAAVTTSISIPAPTSTPASTSTAASTPSPAPPSAKLLAPVVHGLLATLRWSGSATAKTFDVSERSRGVSSTVISNTPKTTLSLHGKHHETIQVRVRARNAAGAVGEWSAVRTVTFH